MSLCRSLHNNGGVGAAFTYVLEHIDHNTHFEYPESPHWHVQSEDLRRERACWQRLNAATNQLEPLSVLD